MKPLMELTVAEMLVIADGSCSEAGGGNRIPRRWGRRA